MTMNLEHRINRRISIGRGARAQPFKDHDTICKYTSLGYTVPGSRDSADVNITLKMEPSMIGR
jgi:hypothetical protein